MDGKKAREHTNALHRLAKAGLDRRESLQERKKLTREILCISEITAGIGEISQKMLLLPSITFLEQTKKIPAKAVASVGISAITGEFLVCRLCADRAPTANSRKYHPRRPFAAQENPIKNEKKRILYTKETY